MTVEHRLFKVRATPLSCMFINHRDGILTVDSLEEDVEDAVARDSKLVLVQESVLDPLLVMFVRIEVIILKVVQEP